MKIRIISDLHLDVNHNYCFRLTPKQKEMFTIIAGDTSGDPRETIDWLKKNVKQGVFITGNHLVYNNRKLPIQELREELAAAFPKTADVTYLDNEVGVLSKEVNGILFIGTCFYTDFNLPIPWRPGDANTQVLNMSISWRNMNDYRWGIKSKKMDGIDRGTPLSPKDYLEWHEKAFANITELIENNEKSEKPLPVVIITHHAPIKDCISGYYVNEDTNASYASDYEWFIKAHPSIKCWVYGHMHADQKEIKIPRNDGSSCVIVNNARGYCQRLEDSNFNVNTILDTDTWEVTRTPLSKNQLDKRKKRADEYYKRMAPFIF